MDDLEEALHYILEDRKVIGSFYCSELDQDSAAATKHWFKHCAANKFARSHIIIWLDETTFVVGFYFQVLIDQFTEFLKTITCRSEMI